MIQVILQISDQCNLQCEYCYRNIAIKSTKKVMDKDIIDKLYLHKAYIDNIIISAGEPLLHLDFILYIASKLKITIFSNLTLMTERIARQFSLSSCRFCTSIDGIKEIHDKRRSNSYDNTTRGIDILRKHNIPVEIWCTYDKELPQIDINYKPDVYNKLNDFSRKDEKIYLFINPDGDVFNDIIDGKFICKIDDLGGVLNSYRTK